jgi:predicted ATP-grasp superfamily ATP-dependent carboligase
MKIFVFEYITGGGLLGNSAAPLPQNSLLTEGRAMARAITADLLAIPDTIVFTTRDSRLQPLHPPGCVVREVQSQAEEQAQFEQLSAAADWTMLIAPETGGALLHRARLAESTGGRLLSPASGVVEIAANKQQTCDWLRHHAVLTPPGQAVNAGESVQSPPWLPAVLKPIDGCGSQQVRLMPTESSIKQALAAIDRPMRLEAFVPGVAASVAVLCGPRERLALPACGQRLSKDGQFSYLGGSTPLPAELDQRARRLATAAVATFPSAVGYVGVDLVLGEATDGSGDYVIEVNPRLTTSYVGLRAACRENIAAAMLTIAADKPAALSFRPEPVEFDADGTIRRQATL